MLFSWWRYRCITQKAAEGADESPLPLPLPSLWIYLLDYLWSSVFMARKGLHPILPSSVWVQMQRQTGDQGQEHCESTVVLLSCNNIISFLHYVFKNIEFLPWWPSSFCYVISAWANPLCFYCYVADLPTHTWFYYFLSGWGPPAGWPWLLCPSFILSIPCQLTLSSINFFLLFWSSITVSRLCLPGWLHPAPSSFCYVISAWANPLCFYCYVADLPTHTWFYYFLSGWGPPAGWPWLLCPSFILSIPCQLTLSSINFFLLFWSSITVSRLCLPGWLHPASWPWLLCCLLWFPFRLSNPCHLILTSMTRTMIARSLWRSLLMPSAPLRKTAGSYSKWETRMVSIMINMLLLFI